jgi:hypothetical protein
LRKREAQGFSLDEAVDECPAIHFALDIRVFVGMAGNVNRKNTKPASRKPCGVSAPFPASPFWFD